MNNVINKLRHLIAIKKAIEKDKEISQLEGLELHLKHLLKIYISHTSIQNSNGYDNFLMKNINKVQKEIHDLKMKIL